MLVTKVVVRRGLDYIMGQIFSKLEDANNSLVLIKDYVDNHLEYTGDVAVFQKASQTLYIYKSLELADMMFEFFKLKEHISSTIANFMESSVKFKNEHVPKPVTYMMKTRDGRGCNRKWHTKVKADKMVDSFARGKSILGDDVEYTHRRG